MTEKDIFKNIEDFYEEYREIKISGNVNRNLITKSKLHEQLISEFENKFNESCKYDSNFSNYVKKNKLNLLDMEIDVLAKFFQRSYIDIKKIFEKISLYEFKEYDFDLFRRYFINSNLIKKKIITYTIIDNNGDGIEEKKTNY